MIPYINRRSPLKFFFSVLLLLVVLLVLMTRLQIPAQLLDFVSIKHTPLERNMDVNSATAIFDQLLLKHRRQLSNSPLLYNAFMRQSIQQEIAAFRLDKCGVKQVDFQRFVQWQRFNPNSVQADEGQPADWHYKTINNNHRILGRADVPASGVSYYDASAYCRANNGRLPTLSEYQAATTGTAGNLYPWGNQPSSEFWPYLDPLLNAAQQCASQPQAATPGQQIYALAHGMLEWASLYPGHSQAALMGAGVNDKPHELYALNFVSRIADKKERIKYAGFRCAYDDLADEAAPTASAFSPWGAEYEAVVVADGLYTIGSPVDSQVLQLLKVTPPGEWYTLLDLFSTEEQQVEKVLHVSSCEVTRRQYRYFLSDPLVKLGFFGHRLQQKGWNYRPLNWQQQLAEPDLPVVGIDWWSAYAFAQWVDGDLPTLKQWRLAASNVGRHLYPWGNDRQQSEQYFMQEKHTQLTVQSCGKRPLDKTENGINDMSGNISEWVLDIAPLGDGYGVAIAGGNYMLPAKQTAAITQHSVADPEYRSMALGFRVVRN